MWWLESLQLRLNEKIILEENGLLTDRHNVCWQSPFTQTVSEFVRSAGYSFKPNDGKI